MRADAHDFYKEAALGLALIALALVGLQIDAKSTFNVLAPAKIFAETPARTCSPGSKVAQVVEPVCRAGLKQKSSVAGLK